jgi:hypothetical protein
MPADDIAHVGVEPRAGRVGGSVRHAVESYRITENTDVLGSQGRAFPPPLAKGKSELRRNST